MRRHIPLAAIIGVAAVARYWAIDFCLPALVCRPDEEAVASIAAGFFARDPNPHFFDWPPVFMYGVALSMVPYFKYVKFTGAIRSEYRFLQSITFDPTPLFLAARIISAAAGTASVWILYRIAIRLFDRTTALVAAAFLALAYLHVRDSHFGVTDVAATFFVLLAMLFCARLAAANTTRDLALAAVMTGLAAATKYNAGAVALPIVWIIATNPARVDFSSTLKQVATFAVAVMVVFLAVCPFTLIEYASFLSSLNALSAHLMNGHGPNIGHGWSVHLTSSLRYGVGAPMLIIGIIGMLWMVRRSPRIGIMALLFPVATYVMIGGGLTVFARYALPIVPFLCLGAAFAVTEAARIVTDSLRLPQWNLRVAWIAAMCCLAPSARSVWQFDRLLGVDDSRLLTAHWIEEHFPQGATIGATERRWDRVSFQAKPESPSAYTTLALTPETIDPDVIVVTESPLHPEGLVAELSAERLARYERVLETSGPERPGSKYDWQDEFYIPLAGLDHLDRPGPRITVLTKK